MNKMEFVAFLDKMRKESPERWLSWVGVVEGLNIRIKFYGTWNQILEIDGVRHGGIHDLKVGAWKKELCDALYYNERMAGSQ
jgi:hypothetical protein